MAQQGKAFTCSYCDKPFETKFRMERHLRCHTNERPFACEQCGRAFRESGHVIKHLIKCPLNNKPDSSSQERKKKRETVPQNHGCKTCYKSFETRVVLREHRRTAHPKVRTESCDCGVRLEKRYMDRHRVRCSYIKATKRKTDATKKEGKDVSGKFPCRKCSRSFGAAKWLRYHKRWEHSNKGESSNQESKDKTESVPRNHVCKTCNGSFETKAILRDHRNTAHPKVESCECGLQLEKPHMDSHKLRCTIIKAKKHKTEAEKETGKGVNGKFPCCKCKLWFVSAKELECHSLTHSLDHIPAHRKRRHYNTFSGMDNKQSRCATGEVTLVPSLGSPTPETVCCSECDDIVWKSTYRQHVRKHTLHRLNEKYLGGYEFASGEIFLCRYITCFLAFPSSQELTGHEASHTGPKPFLCGACDVRSATRRLHDKHVSQCSSQSLLHHPCGSCGRFFRGKGRLRTHQESHPPGGDACGFTCGHCGEFFFTRRELNQHNNNCHQIIEPAGRPKTKGKVFHCKCCSRELKSKEQLVDHIRICHLSELARASPAEPTASRSRSPRESNERGKTPDEEERRYDCMHCNRSFLSKTGKANHEVTHTSENPHVCHICGKGFILKRRLSQHMEESCGIGTWDNREPDAFPSAESGATLPGDSDPQLVIKVEDEVITISSSPSPSPSPTLSPSPSPSPAAEVIHMQRLDTVTVISHPGTSHSARIFDAGPFSSTSGVGDTAGGVLQTATDQVYLVQYGENQSGPLTVAIPNQVTCAAIRIVPAGHVSPADPVPMRLERVL